MDASTSRFLMKPDRTQETPVMRFVMLRLALPTLALAVLTAPADAGQIVTQMNTSTPVMTFTIPSQGINGEGGYVGPNSVSLNNGPFVQAYCTDLFRSIGVNDQYAADIQPLSTLSGGDLVARLFSADAALGGATPADKAGAPTGRLGRRRDQPGRDQPPGSRSRSES